MTPLLVLCAFLFGAAPQTPQPGEVIADVRVHGNHLTPDDEVIRLSGLKKGDPVTESTIETARKALDRSGKFDDVQVLKRYASIEDPTQILIMLVVNEGPVRIELPIDGSPAKIVPRSFGKRVMFLPILDAEDGYGLSYGVRFALPGKPKSQSRWSAPFTWGGERRAGLEWEKNFEHARIEFGGAFTQRTNPFYRLDDARRQGWAHVEAVARPWHAGATASVERVNFGGSVDQVVTLGLDATLDTRLDPLMPRNALYVRASVDQVRLTPNGGTARDPFTRTSIDANAYLGLIRQVVLLGRVVRHDASVSQPAYFKYLLGGTSNLRGFEAGAFAGDTLVAGTLELRMPFTSPLSVGKTGLRVFADAGTAYDKGQRYEDQTLQRGYGAGLFFNAAVFQMTIDVAHGKGAGTRFRVGGGFSF